VSSFADFDLHDTLRATLGELNLTVPTEIQARALPELLARRSVVGIAETGSGKTLTYVLPALQLAKTLETAESPITVAGQPRVLVVVPARELGEQVTRVFKQFTHATRVRVRGAFGGATLEVARRNVSGPHEVLVATPGRLGQLVDLGHVRLSDLRLLVLDEADQLLDLGFLPEVSRLVQTALFSATLPPAVEAMLPQLFRHPPAVLKTRGSHHVVATLTTSNRRVVDGRRFELLEQVLREPTEGSTLIFANTREQCDKLARELGAAGHGHAVYRGEMDKATRRANLAEFREGTVKLLIATDLGARGLDVEGVERVVNYHLPHDVANYLHRVGRTARAGRPGVVINFITERDQKLLAKLDKVKTPPTGRR
jgi:ATP-dependent RNA helicase RhlE